MAKKWLLMMAMVAALAGCVSNAPIPTNEEAAAALAEATRLSEPGKTRPMPARGSVVVAAGHEGGQQTHVDPARLDVSTVAVAACQPASDGTVCSLLVNTSGTLRREEGVRFWLSRNGTWRARLAAH